MQLGLRLPHSLDMTLSANAQHLCGQSVTINTFAILGSMEDNTTNLQMKFYSDIEVNFTIEIVKNSLKIKVICPQLQKEPKFIAYENGSYANIEIVNLSEISLANKKDRIVQLNTKLPSETLLYSHKGRFTKVRSQNGLISFSDCPLYVYDYKHPTPSSLVTASLATTKGPTSSFSAPYIMPYLPTSALSARPRSSTTLHSLIASSSMPSLTNAITNVTTPAIGNLNILNPNLPNVSSSVYYPKDNTRQPPPNPTEVDKDLLTDALHNLSLHNLPEDIIGFDPTNPIPSNDPLYNTSLQPIGVHPDYVDPANFQIDFDSLSLPPSSAGIPITRTSSPTTGALPLHSLSNATMISGATSLPLHSLSNATMISGSTALPLHSLPNATMIPGATALSQTLQNVTKTPATEVLPQHSTGDLSQTFSSVISDDDSNITQIPSPQHDQSDNTKTRNIRIPEDVMNKFLDSIGKDYYSDLDEFSPGLQHTSDGYVYYPDLMESEQGKRLHTFIIRMNTKPGLLKKLITASKRLHQLHKILLSFRLWFPPPSSVNTLL